MGIGKFRKGRQPKRAVTQEDLQELESDIEDLEEQVERLVKSSLDSQLRTYKIAVSAFLLGFLLFVSAGLITEGALIESIIKSIYKPSAIYKDIESSLPGGVWSAVTSGSEDDYKKFVSKHEFYTALSEYHTDLVRTFLVPNREPLIREREIMRVGSIPEDIQILMGGAQIEGQPTARCHKQFKNAEKQAILVVPESFEKTDYAWYDCAFGWPKITVAIEYQDKNIGGIELVGVRRNGGTKQLIVLVSQKAAKDLDLPGWETHKANAFGKIRVSAVN